MKLIANLLLIATVCSLVAIGFAINYQIFFASTKLTPAELYLVYIHDHAVNNGGTDYCYNTDEGRFFKGGWYCISYWGKAGKK